MAPGLRGAAGYQRYWNGEHWTERRADAPEAPAPAVAALRRYAPWVLAVVAGLVVVSAAVLVLGDDDPATSNAGASSPPPASTPGPPAGGKQTTTGPERRTWQVTAAIDGRTIRLTNGAEVRLAGVADSCGTLVLAKMVVGEQVTLTRRGPDKDADGTLLRYVARAGGMDVGQRLIQRGWAHASDEPHARRATYRRIDQRSPDACG